MGTTERREREKQKRREDILTAARALFFEKGLRGTTIDDIARSTELARGTIYLYFETKEEIYATILLEGMDILGRLIQESFDEKADPLTNLLNGHDAYMKFHDDYPQFHSVLIINKMEIAPLIPEQLAGQLNAKMDQMATWIAGILDEGMKQGFFRAMDSVAVAYMQMGMATGFAMMVNRCAAQNAALGDRQQFRQVMHDLIANGVMKRA